MTYSRVCALVRYFPKTRLLVPEAAKIGGGYASDAVLGAEALRAASPGGILLVDAGFDSSEVFAASQGKFIPMIKLKGGGKVRDQMRKEAKRALDLCRLRGVAEGLFGGMKTKLNGALRSLRPEISQREAFLEAICYNLRVYLTLFLFLFLIALFCLRQKAKDRQAATPSR